MSRGLAIAYPCLSKDRAWLAKSILRYACLRAELRGRLASKQGCSCSDTCYRSACSPKGLRRMEQVAKSRFSQTTRTCFQASTRPRTGVQVIRMPARKQHIISERQRLLPAPSQTALDRRSSLQRTVYTPSAVQQQEAAPADLSTTTPTNDDFQINQSQLQALAQRKDSPLFEGASVANVFQLANALRTSLEFGLVTDAQDLENRAAVFGCNTLPSKAEVSLMYLACQVVSQLFPKCCFPFKFTSRTFGSCRLPLQSWSGALCRTSQF